MATGVATQRKTYAGSGTARSIWQRNETDDAATVSAAGYYKFGDIATANIGDLIDIVGPDYELFREITGQAADGSWITGDYGGGGGGTLTSDQQAQIAKQKTQTPNVGDPVAIDQIVIGPDQKQWQNTSGDAAVMPATFDPVPAGWTEYTGTDELWTETTVATTAKADDQWTLKPNHVIDVTGLAVGAGIETQYLASDDHTGGNAGGYEVGTATWRSGSAPTITPSTNTIMRIIRDSATQFHWYVDGTVSITNSGGGTPSNLDLAAIITN